MKKDIIVAVGVGFFLGVVLAIFLINSPNIFKKGNTANIQNIQPSLIPQVSTTPELTLTIDKPVQNFISSEKNIEVSGKYSEGSSIIIESNIEVKTIKVSKDGLFTDKINILEGVNEIYITAIKENLEPVSQTITVFYTPEKL